MWRCDAGRRAYTPDALPAELHLQWVRRLPEPKSAWPWNQYKQQFDASYEPIVKGKLMFVASMVRDSVTAYDTDTGREKWRFYADGPVRFAPVAYKDKLLFASDDGRLYCLRAETGKLLWKFAGAPLQKRLLANGRLSSMYPARGAPVVYDGTVYFAAGIWPFMGTFIHALDADTGRVVWTNSGSGAIYILQPHASPSFAGVAPQGYMVATGSHLLIPGGRAVPAGYDRKTGSFLWHNANTKRGHYTVWATDKIFWNDRQIGAAADGSIRGGSGAWVVTDKAQIGLEGGSIVGRALNLPYRKGKSVVQPQVLWQVGTGGAIDRTLIAAGGRAYGAKAGLIAAFDTADGKGLVWKADVEGKVWNMLAADNKLFVVTQEGRVYCFGEKKTEPRKFEYRADPPGVRQDEWSAKSAEILRATGVEEGYCVVLGLGSGRLAEEILRLSKLDLIVLERDADKVDAARRRFDEAGWYGKRVHLVAGDLASIQMPPYLASLIVAESPGEGGLESAEGMRKAFQMLRPYGGTICVYEQGNLSAVSACAKALKLGGAEVASSAGMTRVVRAGALAGSADWSHQYGDISNSVFSADRNVKAPVGALWFGGSSNMDILPRHGHGPTPHVVAGRLVIEGIGVLNARDVYTGRTIWRRELPKLNTFGMYYNQSYKPDPYDRSYNQGHIPGANMFGSNYVTTADKVYLISQTVCHVLDAATGKTITDFKLPAGPGSTPSNWGFVGVSGDLLIAAGRPIQVPEEKRDARGLPDVKGYTPLIEKNARWQYLGGSHPKDEWTQVGYRASGWKVAQAGFGYADNDDTTVLADMKGRYSVLYVRKTFRVKDPADIASLALGISFDDAFIAYLNGREVLRAGVRGRGAGAKGVGSHEGGPFEHYEIPNAGSLLRKGVNVLALEGHNKNPNSSDFSLHPYLLFRSKAEAQKAAAGVPLEKVPGVKANTRASSSSRLLVVMDRRSGKVIWQRPATYGYRHNAIVAGGGKLFVIDKLTDPRIAYLSRRGANFAKGPTIYALDIRTGDVVWQTSHYVFGTWLGYSAEHDVLLQGGSRAGDRAYDEVGAGMIAYRGRNGNVLWQRGDAYSGPPVLYHDMILTQTGGGNAVAPPAPVFNLLTGKIVTRQHPLTGQTIPWNWVRFKGCNTAVASENMLLFRSGAASFVPMDVSQGTASIGGFKSGCTSNLIAANGVLNAPDYTRTCTCAYQQQSSLGMVHMPELEYWTFDYFPPPSAPTSVDRVGINFGAPGNRTAANGTLWLEFPSVGGPSPDIPVRVAGEKAVHFRAHNTMVAGEMNWVAASFLHGVESLKIRPFVQAEKRHKVVYGFAKHMGNIPRWAENAVRGKFARPTPYTVRLYFVEMQHDRAGERVFSVSLQGRTVLRNFDIASAAGGRDRTVVREFKNVKITDDLVLTFQPVRGRPVISGIELIAE